MARIRAHTACEVDSVREAGGALLGVRVPPAATAPVAEITKRVRALRLRHPVLVLEQSPESRLAAPLPAALAPAALVRTWTARLLRLGAAG
ncbi:MAG: hypothetical protein EA406_07935 [Rhodospirillales bacterium]|nr:MAG: hypothetical protein EA406_07935 [Rhodospirillales bacterium]